MLAKLIYGKKILNYSEVILFNTIVSIKESYKTAGSWTSQQFWLQTAKRLDNC